MKIESEQILARPDKPAAPADRSDGEVSSRSRHNERHVETNLDRVDTEAENALRKVFDMYDPEKEDSDILFYSAAYDLNRLYRPDAPPENTGSLEKGIAEKIESLLQKLVAHYPHAVQRFRFLFCSEKVPQKSTHKYDPQVFIRDEQKALAYYLENIENQPGEVTDFAFQAIASTQNSGLGIEIMQNLVKKMGWEYIIAQALPPDSSQSSAKRYFKELKECLHKLSTPRTLDSARIKQLLNQTKDDIEYAELKGYLFYRLLTENLVPTDDSFCRSLLRDHDIPFYDTKKTRTIAASLLAENRETYHGLLEELRHNVRQMYSNYDGEPDSPIVHSLITKYEAMNIDGLLHTIPSVYAFNIIMAYVPDDEGILSPKTLAKSEKGGLVRSLMLDEKTLRKETQKLISKNDTAYFTALFDTEMKSKKDHTATSQCVRNNFIPILQMHAKREGRANADVWGYTLNSSARVLAHNTLALFSPTGRPLGIYKIDDQDKSEEEDEEENDSLFADMYKDEREREEEERKFKEWDGIRELEDFLKMKHILSDTRSFTSFENTATVMLLFWERLPEEWCYQLIDMYRTFDVDICSFVSACPDSFELAVNFSQDVAGLLSHFPEFVDALDKYVDDKIDEFTNKEKYPQEIDMNEFLVLMNAEYGQTNISEEGVKELLSALNYDTVSFLQENLKFDFNKISRRELFSLLLYLKNNNHGGGFDALYKSIGKAKDEDAQANRIKTFLSLEQEGATMGEKIIDIGQQLPEAADMIFQKYAELIESTDKVESGLKTLYDTSNERKYIEQIRASLVKKANNLLLESHKVLQGVVFSHEISMGEGILNRSTDSSADERAHEDYKKIEAEEINKLKYGLAQIKVDIEITKNVIRTLRENKELQSLAELKGFEQSVLAGPDIPEGEDSIRAHMRTLYDKNYPLEKYSKAFRIALFQGLEEAFKNPESCFHFVTRGNKLIAYLRFDDIGTTKDGRKKVHFGSFNVDRELQGSKIGETFLDERLEQESQDTVFEASADYLVPVSSHYIEKNGFTASGIEPLADRLLLTIRLDTEHNKRLLSKRFKGFTKERTKELAEKNENLGREYLVFKKFSSPKELQFPKGGWLMTHYFHEKDGSVYAVFEQDPDVRKE